MKDMQLFNIDPENPIAVYSQIENLIKFAIANKQVEEGEALPSIREMAITLGVNPNTVTKAYRDLEILGILNTRRGIGVTVRDKAFTLCRDSTREMAASHLRDAVGECIASGIPAQDVRKLTDKTTKSGYRPYSGGNGSNGV